MNQKWADLGKEQEAFAVAISRLILWAHENGIAVRKIDAFRAPSLHGAWGEKKAYGSAYSLHKLKLAQDLWTKNEADYIRLHNKWDDLGGSDRIANDMNHFSFEWMGYR